MGDPNWQNYMAQAKMKFTDTWKTAGIIAYYNGSAGYYLKVGLNATVGSNTIQLLKSTTVVAATLIPGHSG